MTFFPLDRDLLTSSTWAQGSPEAIKVWVYLLLAADPRTGTVEDADPGIALRCGLTVSETTTALEWLASPDAFSRTKDYQGRRITRLPGGGYQVLNYLGRRDKDYSTPRWRRWKERQKEAAANAPTDANGVGNDVQEQEHVQEQEQQRTEQRIAAASPAAAQTSLAVVVKASKPSWSREACDLWVQRFDGTAPGGKIGQALKPLVTKHGWPAVQVSWKNYLGQVEAEFASPSRFATTYGEWSGSSFRPSAGLNPKERQHQEAMVKGVSGGFRNESSVGGAHDKR